MNQDCAGGHQNTGCTGARENCPQLLLRPNSKLLMHILYPDAAGTGVGVEAFQHSLARKFIEESCFETFGQLAEFEFLGDDPATR